MIVVLSLLVAVPLPVNRFNDQNQWVVRINVDREGVVRIDGHKPASNDQAIKKLLSLERQHYDQAVRQIKPGKKPGIVVKLTADKDLKFDRLVHVLELLRAADLDFNGVGFVPPDEKIDC